ncbi:MAG: 4-alpha-glucanotransferase [Oscillospiraceae bacterium]|nr:4-alpha-glucanotransferase [Oscillospiraceae bacterium]
MRKSGILMHITSLPGPYGIGTMGSYAYRFLDFLKQAGQGYWQILPLSPTGFGDSPYQAFSTCAGNHYLIDLDMLVQDGLLRQEELDSVCWGDNPSRVDFGCLYRERIRILKMARDRFQPNAAYQAFLAENANWLEDYCLFMAIKTHLGGCVWTQWPQKLKFRDPEALAQIRRDLDDDISLHCFAQFCFDNQWKALRNYAEKLGIRIIGDVPIYVPLDSADVWTSPELFQLDDQLRPIRVAGCPPDAFSADGQLWGNPLYNWEKMADSGYAWWINRLDAAAKMYDVIRFDHFRGFESYWSVPAKDITARDGRWEPGPGMDFIRAVQQALPGPEFIAEDLGFITPEVRQLQVDSGYPGMKVLEFAFDSREESDYLPHLYPVDSVCYTGTHDNEPLAQWFETADPQDVAYAKAYLGLNEEEGFIWGMIRGCMGSISRLCVVQMQDYLELGSSGRMNFPGTLTSDNWTWRADSGFDSEALANRIRSITKCYGRLN